MTLLTDRNDALHNRHLRHWHPTTKPTKTIMTQSTTFLASIPLFANLPKRTLQRLATDLTPRYFAQGDTIFHQGDPGEVLYLVKSGQIRIFVHGNGQETSVILFGHPGDIFGELAIVDGLPRSANATAMVNTWLYTLDREQFRAHMRYSPQLALNFMKLLTVRVRYNTKQVNSLASQGIPGRLARLLLRLAQEYGEAESYGVRINANLNDSDLASLIGASRESTNKTLSIFRRQDLIRKDNGHIIIIDPDSLRDKVNS
jgi:CRP/FNR family cyclic AMP-dependent transcriptional regulator